MVIPSSWWVPMVAFAGGPTTVALLITLCTSRYPISSPIFVRDSIEVRLRSMHILLLSQEQCGFCTQAKEMLDRLSVEYGFSFSTLNVGSAEGQTLAMSGG